MLRRSKATRRAIANALPKLCEEKFCPACGDYYTEDSCPCQDVGESEDIEDSWSDLEENWNEDKEP